MENGLTLETLYKSIKCLSEKCDTLETEVERLKSIIAKPRCIKTKTPRIKIVPEIVNNNRKSTLWTDYHIIVVQSQMKYIFEGDMVYAIEKIIEDNFEELPLTACKEKSNILYVYGFQNELSTTNGAVWTIFTENQFMEWMQNIKHQILKEFLKWKADQEKKYDDEEENIEQFIEKCMQYLQRIIGGNKTNENESVFKWLCKKLKQQ